MKLKEKISNSNLGTIGEMLVAANVMSHGHDAILANMTINNIASYDLICRNNETGKVALVQVKTSVQKSFPVGLQIKNASSELVDKKVIGPWVFVYVNNKNHETEFEYYILTREEVINLIKQSNEWYWKKYHREVPIKDTNVVALSLDWINGKGVEKTTKHDAFENPLNGAESKDKWDKLWID